MTQNLLSNKRLWLVIALIATISLVLTFGSGQLFGGNIFKKDMQMMKNGISPTSTNDMQMLKNGSSPALKPGMQMKGI